jgi:hypothetical protein
MRRTRRFRSGGTGGNEQLVVFAGAALLVLLAIEGATLLRITSLLGVHALVGILLIPVVGLKLAATGWRALRYYRGSSEYVRRGPPPFVLRVLVAPVVVLSTVVLLATGVALLALDRTQGTLVALHKAAFVVWLPATGIHVLAHLTKLPGHLLRRVPGLRARLATLGAVLVAGAALAVFALPTADRLQDSVSGAIAVDAR